ncbi:MAG: flagellar basal body protein [Gammaproteobacteria bacterium]|nr:flagellar basal body protein [Gammaproteobacteria bacterium]
MTEINSVSSQATAQLVTFALNASMAKHAAFATNIANANSVGYRPLYVSFDDHLAMVQGRLLDRRQDASMAQTLESLQPSLQPIADPTADKVQVDSEVARMVQNTVHYQALLQAYNKMASINRLAVTGGR